MGDVSILFGGGSASLVGGRGAAPGGSNECPVPAVGGEHAVETGESVYPHPERLWLD